MVSEAIQARTLISGSKQTRLAMQTLNAPADFTVSSIRDSWDSWRASIEADPIVTVNLENVTEIDSCAIQLLMYVRKLTEVHDGSLTLTAVSSEILSPLTLFGLQDCVEGGES